MPTSANELPKGSGLAIAAETLYLLNLLLLPGIAFILLAVLFLFKYPGATPIARNHISQTVAVSIWAGVLLIIVNGSILFLGGYDGPNIWIIVIIYFTTVHSILILLGVIGLVKAMAGQCWRYPVIGPANLQGCDSS